MNHVISKIDGPIGVITLNNPEKHNAFDDVVIAELTAALMAMEKAVEVRVVVIAAAGKSFSAGADLNWMKRMAGYSPDENFHDAMGLGTLMKTLHGLKKPTVARVQGAAYGGGVGLVACCDIAVGTMAAAFSLSEAKLGLIPAVISPYVIAAIGERASHRYFLTAEKFDAHEAHRLGLLHEVAATDAEMDARISELCKALLAAGPDSQAESKSLIAAVANRPLNDELVAETAQRIARVRASAEGREGLAAFLEKRPPAWAGKTT